MADWVRDLDILDYKKEKRTIKTTAVVMGQRHDETQFHQQNPDKKILLSYSLDSDNEEGESVQRKTTSTTTLLGAGRISNHNRRTATTTTAASTFTFTVAQRKRKLRKAALMNAGKSGKNATATPATTGSENYDNVKSSTSGGDTDRSNWKGSLSKWNKIARHVLTTPPPPTTKTSTSTTTTKAIIQSINRWISKNNTDQQQQTLPDEQLPLLARSIRTTVTTTGGERDGEGILRGKRRMNSSGSSRLSSSALTAEEEFSVASSGVGIKLIMSAAEPGTGGGGGRVSGGGVSSSSGIHPLSPSLSDSTNPHNNNYIVGGGDDVVDVGVSRRLLDIHQISSRLHRSFPWEGLGLHRNATITAGSIGHSITDRIGFNPATTPHTLMFSSLYIVPLILLLGLVVGLIWLFCACTYHTMKRIKFALCPGRASGGSRKKGKSSNNDPAPRGGFEDVNKKPQILTPEILEMRRQERLAFLQAECANLEQQLTGLRSDLASPQSTFEEKSATLTSRASDSDLEYLGASESPPLKRNSISLQDIPQSVIRIRREKELRQIKEEIEYLRSIAQQEKEKVAQVAKALKGSLLITHDFELPASKPGSPSDTKVEPLSQHISHLKTQRKLNEIRTELEDLAIQLLHADEIKAKRSSLQELPRTAINIQREQNLISMTNEIQKIKNYKLQKRNLIETALEKTSVNPKGASDSAADSGKQSGSKSFNPSIKSPSTKEDVAAKYSDPDFVRGASIRRQREQELNRVRVELKDLAYKLNLNPMNYISEDRVRLVPSQSMQSTSSVTGQSSYNKSAFSASALNHV